jgi:uncharacterized lipoprotein YajG
MMRTLLTITFAALVLSGCSALPAQNLELHPAIHAGAQLPRDTRVQIQVEDKRLSALVGLRLDRLKNTAPLSLVNATQALEHSIEHALEDMGITNFSAGEFTLTLYLDELSYIATQKNLLQEVATKSSVRLEVAKDGEYYTGRYSTEQSKTFVSTPTPADNDALINSILSETLSRAFADKNLTNFLLTK